MRSHILINRIPCTQLFLSVLTCQLYDEQNATKEAINTANPALKKQKEATVLYMSGNDCILLACLLAHLCAMQGFI